MEREKIESGRVLKDIRSPKLQTNHLYYSVERIHGLWKIFKEQKNGDIIKHKKREMKSKKSNQALRYKD